MSNEVMTVGHRADGFAVRRWLRLGAASAGVGAALWGMALVGPQLGTAVADDGASSSTSAASGSDPSASSGGSGSRTVRVLLINPRTVINLRSRAAILVARADPGSRSSRLAATWRT